jgi:hypothetical protein
MSPFKMFPLARRELGASGDERSGFDEMGVIKRVIARELTSVEAGELLCLSGRQVKRLARQFR